MAEGLSAVRLIAAEVGPRSHGNKMGLDPRGNKKDLTME